MNSELSNHVSESDETKMHNSEPEIIKKIWPGSLTKNSGLAPGTARKILQRNQKITKHGTGDQSEPVERPPVLHGRREPHVCSGASCYVWKIFLDFFTVFKIFVKMFVHNGIYR